LIIIISISLRCGNLGICFFFLAGVALQDDLLLPSLFAHLSSVADMLMSDGADLD